MPFVTNILPKPTEGSFVPYPYLDTLYDFTQYIQTPIGVPQSPPQRNQVAIIGAGPAGLVAAYELLRAGLVPVVYEASDRIGGRLYSRAFSQGGFAEMGAMRFPESAKTFWHYANLFKFTNAPFPDPGKVPTLLYYENNLYPWPKDTAAPGPFERISKDWADFINPIVASIRVPWSEGDLETVKKTWQRYIDRFKDVSMYRAIQEGIPHWDDEDLNAFGALGVGSGGFGPLYQVNFLELLRIIINGWEDNQQLIAEGIETLADRFYATPVQTPYFNGSLQSMGLVKFNSKVTKIEIGSDGNPQLYFGDSQPPIAYRAVIVATTTRAMEMMGLTLQTGGVNLNQGVKKALRNLHLMDSSKLFIQTATKFWQGNDSSGKPYPQNIQTDELPRGVYCLDYPAIKQGVIAVSYTWGDDSSKLLGLPIQERFELMKKAIARIHPEFAENLVPLNGQIYNIDWEAEPNFYGAFKLQYPGQEEDIHQAYFQFLSALDPQKDQGLYLAGDSVSWSGGWVEGALQTGLNAAASVLYRLGIQGSGVPSPLSQNPNMYRYNS